MLATPAFVVGYGVELDVGGTTTEVALFNHLFHYSLVMAVVAAFCSDQASTHWPSFFISILVYMW